MTEQAEHMTEHTAPADPVPADAFAGRAPEDGAAPGGAELYSPPPADDAAAGTGEAAAGPGEAAAPTEVPASGAVPDEDVVEALRDVVDPELGINVVDLGLVYGVTVGGDGVAIIDMTLTSAACPLTDVIEDQTASALEGLVPDFRINWVWLPPWGPDKITEDGREQLRALGFNV